MRSIGIGSTFARFLRERNLWLLGDRQIRAKRLDARPRITCLLDELSEATLFAGDLVGPLLPRGGVVRARGLESRRSLIVRS